MVPAWMDQKQSKPQPEADVKSCSGESLSSTCRSWRQDWTKPTRSGRWRNTPSDGEPHASQHSEHRQRQPLVPSRLTRGNKASEEEKRHQQDIPVSLAGNPPQFYQTEVFKPLVAHRSWRCAEAEESCLICSAGDISQEPLTITSFCWLQNIAASRHEPFPRSSPAPEAASLCVWSRESLTLPWPLPVKPLLRQTENTLSLQGDVGRVRLP